MKVLEVEVEVGKPWVIGPLAIFPLLSSATGRTTYIAGPDAFDKGLVKLSELDPPEVASLAVENLAPVPLLLVEGETLVGGNQNRTLNTTVLVPVASRIVVPVSCVEAGRWGRHREVARSRAHLPGSIRAAKVATLSMEEGPGRWRSDQGLVWEEIDRQAQRYHVQSETAALEDVQEAADRDLESVVEDVTPVPLQVGIACVAQKRVLGVDLFDRTETLASYLRGVIAGYWLDAGNGDGAVLVSDVEQFLAQVGQSQVVGGRGVGIGEEVRLSGAVTGLGLQVDGDLVHLAAFPQPVVAC